jgi:RNA polymerase sigma-70 factor, ECF subfamily
MKRATRSKLTATSPRADLTRHRREILAFCYRMTASIHDAEDSTQDTFARAFAAIDRFDGKAPRAWLYRIATNVCLDLLRKRTRRERPADRAPAADPTAAIAPPLPETTWVEPVPDALIDYTSSETIALGYVALLQHVAPRARAVLLARDVLELSTTETATMLGITEAAVNGMLYRARAALRAAKLPTSRALDAVDPDLLVRFVRAWRDGDADAIVALLRADATLEMPPLGDWYAGRKAIHTGLSTRLLASGTCFDLVPVRANGMPAFAMYRRRAGARVARFWSIALLRVGGDAIAEMTWFVDPRLSTLFDVPAVRSGVAPRSPRTARLGRSGGSAATGG